MKPFVATGAFVTALVLGVNIVMVQPSPADTRNSTEQHYRAEIMARIRKHLHWPTACARNFRLGRYKIHMTPKGHITTIDVLEAADEPACEKALLTAIHRAAPLPLPSSEALAEKTIQEGIVLDGKLSEQSVALLRYRALIVHAIRKYWHPPSHFVIKKCASDRSIVTLNLRIEPNGNVAHVFVSHPSCAPAFDADAIRSVQKASPLPPPPTVIAPLLEEKGIAISFAIHAF